MSYNYNAPCRALIMATMNDGTSRSVSIPYTGYGTIQHTSRWLAKGARNVTVVLWSTSTGREICTDRTNSTEENARFAKIAAFEDATKLATGCDFVMHGKPAFRLPRECYHRVVTDDFGDAVRMPWINGSDAELFHGFSGEHDEYSHRGFRIF